MVEVCDAYCSQVSYNRVYSAGEKPHQCDVCQKRFSSTSNLKTHLRLHSGQKPYACDLCPSKFTQFVHLKLHKRLHTNERPYTCSTCNKKYISPSGLRTHWKTTTCKPSASQQNSMEDVDDDEEDGQLSDECKELFVIDDDHNDDGDVSSTTVQIL